MTTDKGAGPIRTDWTDHPTCPFCGYVERDWFEWGSDEDGENSCGRCDKPYLWSRHVSVNFSTKAKP